MPIIPPVTSAPYATGETCLQLVRTLLLDAGISLNGDILSDTSPFTMTLLEAAYEYTQDELANAGYEFPISETILLNVTPVPAAAQNPSTRVYIDYGGYFDGSNANGAPALPQDCLIPLVMAERTAGQPTRFLPMEQSQDGLPLRQQYAYMQQWDWRDDRIYMVGAVQALDLWLRYQQFFPQLTGPSDVIKIFHGTNAVAYAMCCMYCEGRDAAALPSFNTKMERCIKQIVTRTTHKVQRKNVRRMPYGAPRGGTWGENY